METTSAVAPGTAAGTMHLASSRLLVRALPVFTILAALLFFSSQLRPLFQRGGGPAALPAPVAERGDLTRQEKATIELFRDAAPSVVHINTKEVRRSRFSLSMREIERGSGSGFVWDDEGHIVTNFHVLAGASSVEVTLADQTTWEAKLVGAAPEKDLAVIKIEAPKDALAPTQVGSSADLVVGQFVMAIGNPFGLDQTLTTGVLSAVGRDIEVPLRSGTRTVRDVLQTDAAINPGNSGGPLLDSAGRLIGVNTQIVSPSGAFAGIGFAIPADTVNWVVPQLINHGELKRPQLGIALGSRSARDYVRRQFGLEGVVIRQVYAGTGADDAGLQGYTFDERGRPRVGDVIVEVDGEKTRTEDELLHLLERRDAGDTVQVTYVRGGDTATVPVTLQSRQSRR